MWVWELSLFPLGQSTVHATRPSCSLRTVVIVYISADHFVTWSPLRPRCDLLEPSWSLCSFLEGSGVSCTLLFLPGDAWPSAPASVTHPAAHSPYLQTWFRYDSQETILWNTLKARPEVSHLCAPQKPTSLLACPLHPVMWSADPLLVCTSRLSSLRVGSGFS